jgi:hypothetical protein
MVNERGGAEVDIDQAFASRSRKLREDCRRSPYNNRGRPEPRRHTEAPRLGMYRCADAAPDNILAHSSEGRYRKRRQTAPIASDPTPMNMPESTIALM